MKYILLLIISTVSITTVALWGEIRHHHGVKQAYQEIDYKLNEGIRDGRKFSIKGLTPDFYPRKDKAVIAGAGSTNVNRIKNE
jgi:hypothetical protein